MPNVHVGFAGSVADAFYLLDMLETNLKNNPDNILKGFFYLLFLNLGCIDYSK